MKKRPSRRHSRGLSRAPAATAPPATELCAPAPAALAPKPEPPRWIVLQGEYSGFDLVDTQQREIACTVKVSHTRPNAREQALDRADWLCRLLNREVPRHGY